MCLCYILTVCYVIFDIAASLVKAPASYTPRLQPVLSLNGSTSNVTRPLIELHNILDFHNHKILILVYRFIY